MRSDRHPHPKKEFLEGDPHQPQALRRIERAERRAQADIDRKHAANPDDGTEDVHGEGHGGGHERASSSRMTRLASTEASRPDNDGELRSSLMAGGILGYTFDRHHIRWRISSQDE